MPICARRSLSASVIGSEERDSSWKTVDVPLACASCLRWPCALGLFSPMMRGLAEMAYEFEEPFVLDTTKYRSTFGTATTPLSTAIAETVGWYRRDVGA
jgi:hypothetical protein